MASSIGIKIANGEFYPIMEENSMIRKRMILTTVHNNQPGVQIDLYRSANSTMSAAQYIGSIVVENIKPKPKGEPSIEMVISSNSIGEITADAVDLDKSSSREHHVLTVSLQSLDEASRDVEIHDYELEASEEPPPGLYNSDNVRRKPGSIMWIFIIIGLVIILGIAALWLFLFGGLEIVTSVIDRPAVTQLVSRQPEPVIQVEPVRQAEPVREPEPVVQAEPVVMEAEPVVQIEPVVEPEPVREPEPAREPEPVREPEPEPVPVIQAPAVPPQPPPQPVRRRPVPPVASYRVPSTIPSGGVSYRIRYGDTLWDIAEAFYRNPWLYPRIARYNNIRNPDYIISGRTIRIPPRN